MQLNEKLEALTDSLKEYVDTNYELIKLEVIDHTSDVISAIISTLIIGVLLVLFLIFGSFYLAFYLSDLLEVPHIGFAIVGGFYLILGLFVHLNKRRLVENRVCNNFIKRKVSKNI